MKTEIILQFFYLLTFKKDKTIVFREKMSQFTQITRIIVLYCKPYTFKVYMNLTLSSKKNVTYCYNS